MGISLGNRVEAARRQRAVSAAAAAGGEVGARDLWDGSTGSRQSGVLGKGRTSAERPPTRAALHRPLPPPHRWNGTGS